MTNNKNNWPEYIDQTKDAPPRPLLIKAVEFVKSKNSALDLGAGALNDTKYLLSKGFKKVVAVDKTNLAEEISKCLPQDRVEYIINSFEEYNFPKNVFDIINAQFSLPFTQPNSFNEVFNKLKGSLKIGGVFSGQLFGIRDDWYKQRANMSFHSREKVEQLLSNMEIIELNEEEKDENPAVGNIKHWHVFHIIARKNK